jgi:hypothetical protein
LTQYLEEIFRKLALQEESRIEEVHPDVGSCAYDDCDTAEVLGVSGDWVYQGKERDPPGPGVPCTSKATGLVLQRIGFSWRRRRFSRCPFITVVPGGVFV